MLYFFFIVLIIANLFYVGVWSFGSKLFPYILSVPTQILMPFVIVMCICGVAVPPTTTCFLIVVLGAVGFPVSKLASKYGSYGPGLCAGQHHRE